MINNLTRISYYLGALFVVFSMALSYAVPVNAYGGQMFLDASTTNTTFSTDSTSSSTSTYSSTETSTELPSQQIIVNQFNVNFVVSPGSTLELDCESDFGESMEERLFYRVDGTDEYTCEKVENGNNMAAKLARAVLAPLGARYTGTVSIVFNTPGVYQLEAIFEDPGDTYINSGFVTVLAPAATTVESTEQLLPLSGGSDVWQGLAVRVLAYAGLGLLGMGLVLTSLRRAKPQEE